MKECNFAVEACWGLPMHYDNWFEYMMALSSSIFDQTKRYIGATTIKRLFGYINDNRFLCLRQTPEAI